MRQNRIAIAAVVATALLWVSAPSVEAQARGTRMGTRTSLQAELESLQQQAAATSDSKIIEQIRHEIEAIAYRLREGDIFEGDVIALAVAGELSWSSDFIVTPSRMIELTDIAPLSVANVLYSELEAYLTDELGKYLREPRVRAEALKRIAVLGAVGAPGFMTAPGSMIVSDLIMQAGGPMSTAQVDKAEFRRMGSKLDLEGPVAFQAYSLDQLGIRSGDELHIPARPPAGSFFTGFRLVLLALGSVVALSRVF